MKKLSYDEMVLKIKIRFPKLTIKDSKEFYGESTQEKFGIWLPNSEDVRYTDKDNNTLYRAMMYNDNKNYTFEVYDKFDNWCQRYGWYATTESYAMQIFKN